MRYLMIPLVLFSLIFSSCQRRGYVAQDFDDRTVDHRVIAVIPSQLIYTGRLPADWTEAQEEQMRLEESTLLQQTVKTALLNRAGNFRNSIRIDFQSVYATNNRLREVGIEPHLAYREDPALLVGALGVDAIVLTSINKERFISEEASAAISVVGQVLSSVGAPTPGGLLGRAGRTYSVDIVASLVDGTGITLYSDQSEINIDWRTSTNESVEPIAQWVARGFPYRMR